MKKQSKRRGRFALALLFIAGALLFLLPILSELSSYRADENEYETMAEHVRPTESSAATVPTTELPSPEPTKESLSHETPYFFPLGDATASPIAEPAFTPLPLGAVEVSEAPATVQPTVIPPALPEVQLTATPDNSQGVLPTATPGNSQSVQVTQAPAGVDLVACLNQNKDFIAWLTIPGTKIDYPVVRSDNSAYYLTHLFSGKESKLGCLFSLKSSDYQTPSKNIAIYGHHLSNNNAMFSTLMSYKSASYCSRHSTIRLDSLYGTRNYRVFAVLNMTVTDWDASTASFPSNESFLRFVNHAQELSLYDTGVRVTAEDHILTLITCDRSFGGADGRLIVMAVQE